MSTRQERRIERKFGRARRQVNRAKQQLTKQTQLANQQAQAIQQEQQRLSSQEAIRQIRSPGQLEQRNVQTSNLQQQAQSVAAFKGQLQSVGKEISQAESEINRAQSRALEAAGIASKTVLLLPSGERAVFSGGSQSGTLISPEGVAVGSTTRDIFSGADRGFTGGQSVLMSTSFGEGVAVPGFTPVGTTPSGGLLVSETRDITTPSFDQTQSTRTQEEIQRRNQEIRHERAKEALARGDLPEVARQLSGIGAASAAQFIERATDPLFSSGVVTAFRERGAETIPGVEEAQLFFSQPVSEEQLQTTGASIFFAPAFLSGTAGTELATQEQKIAAQAAARRRTLESLRNIYRRVSADNPSQLSRTGAIRQLRKVISDELESGTNAAELRKLIVSDQNVNAASIRIVDDEIKKFLRRAFVSGQIDIPRTGGAPPTLTDRPFRVASDPEFVSSVTTVPQLTVPQRTITILSPTGENIIGLRTSTLPRPFQIQSITPTQLQSQPQLQSQLQRVSELQRLAQPQINLQRAGQSQSQIQSPRLSQLQVPAQKLAQPQVQVTIPSVPTLSFRIPRTPGIPPPQLKPTKTFDDTQAKLDKLKGKAVNVVVGKGNRKRVILRNLPPNLAMKKGLEHIKRTIRASFVLKPTGKVTKKKDIRFTVPNQQEFRPGKTNALRVVERQNLRLNTPKEKVQLAESRRTADRKRKGRRLFGI